MIKGFNKTIFDKYNLMYIDNVLYGIEKFNHICFTGEYKQYKNFIQILIKNNEESFFDFYFANLKEDEKAHFFNNKQYKNVLKKFYFEKDNIYFDTKHIDNEIFDFITKISFNQMLFSTFYFKNPSLILWTNYNKQFILFLKDDDIQKYINVAKNFGLNIVFEKVII